MRSAHLIQELGSTQSTVAISPDRAELTGICKSASRAIGLRSVAADLGFPLQLEITSDESAAIGMCKLRGLAKVRHLAAADLWLQDRGRTNDFTRSMIDGAMNPADVLATKVTTLPREAHEIPGPTARTRAPRTSSSIRSMNSTFSFVVVLAGHYGVIVLSEIQCY